MTKCIVLGSSPIESNYKPIEFLHVLNSDLKVVTACDIPAHFDYIELICRNYTKNIDLMFAYNYPTNRNEGILLTGHWNDGIVEWK